MESIITKEVLNKVWEIGNQRLIELDALKTDYPTLTNQIRDLRKDYIVCLNAISSRDFNTTEKYRKILDVKESMLADLVKEKDEDNERHEKAKKIKTKKEESSTPEVEIEELEMEQENGK
jgi:hypothetical protein